MKVISVLVLIFVLSAIALFNEYLAINAYTFKSSSGNARYPIAYISPDCHWRTYSSLQHPRGSTVYQAKEGCRWGDVGIWWAQQRHPDARFVYLESVDRIRVVH